MFEINTTPEGFELSNPQAATHVWDYDGQAYSRSLRGWLKKLVSETLVAEDINTIKLERDRYFNALSEIINPVLSILNQTPDGYVFDGDLAHKMSSDPNYAIKIAKKALACD